MRTRLKLIARLFAVVAAPWATVLLLLTQTASNQQRADEGAIGDVLRRLEQDINSGRVFEIFAHIVHVDSDNPEEKESEYALMDSFRELSSIEALNLTVVEIAFSEEGRAMVEARASGFTRASPGDKKPVSCSILFKFVKQDGAWKIAGQEQGGAIHSLQPMRRTRPGGENP